MGWNVAERFPILLVCLENWISHARLNRALRDGGFAVAVLAAPGDFVTLSRFVERRFDLRAVPGRPGAQDTLGSLQDAIEAFRPRFLLPADERTVRLFRLIAAVDDRSRPRELSDRTLRLVRRALGTAASHAIRRQRHALMELATRTGIRMPPQTAVTTPAEARAFAAAVGYPIVLKAEDTVGGQGVRVCDDETALAPAIAALRPATATEQPPLIAQAFIPGRSAARNVVAVEGESLGGFSNVKLTTHPGPRGPGAVNQFIRHPDMDEAMRKTVAGFGFTGIGVGCFVIDDRDGSAWLVEFNPRPGSHVHFAPLWGFEMCKALHARLSGTGEVFGEGEPTTLIVAKFPNEWMRDPASPYLRTAYHDVPWDDPDLLAAEIRFATEAMARRGASA